MAVADHVHERQQHVESRAQRRVKASEPFDDVSALLGDDDRGLGDDDDHQDGEDGENDNAAGHERSPSASTISMRRSTRTTVQRRPLGRSAGPLFRALQDVPRSSTRPMSLGAMSCCATAASPTSESTSTPWPSMFIHRISGLRKNSSDPIDSAENNSSSTHSGVSAPSAAIRLITTAATPKKMM